MKRIIYCSIAREQSKNGRAAVLCKQDVEAGFCIRYYRFRLEHERRHAESI